MEVSDPNHAPNCGRNNPLFASGLAFYLLAVTVRTTTPRTNIFACRKLDITTKLELGYMSLTVSMSF